MNSPSREEIDAKLETIDAKMAGRIALLESGMASMSEALKDLKSSMIVTAISTVLAIAAFNATVLSNMVASFESGKNTAKDQAELRKQVEETGALLKRIQVQLDERKSDAGEAAVQHSPK
jgi:high-affinity nickel permease